MSLRSDVDKIFRGLPDMPCDQDAERAVVGWMLIKPEAIEHLIERLTVTDLWNPQLSSLFGLIVGEYTAGRSTDINAILPIAMERVRGVDGPYLLEAMQAPLVTGSLDSLVTRVREKSIRRTLVTVGASTAVGAIHRTAVSAQSLVETLRGDVDRLSEVATADSSSPMPMSDFLAGEITYDWLVDGLIERQERIMVTAPESFGKSTLMRQLVVTISAGLHPFNYSPTTPRRVLLVDCENPPGLNQRRYRALTIQARNAGWIGEGLWIDAKPEGLDLTGAQDAAWLVSRVRKVHPELLAIGPIYKIQSGDVNDESVARKVTSVLDYIRGKFGCALLMEAHSPHGTGPGARPVRPFGASLWRRWPDFGLGLRPVHNGEQFDRSRLAEVVQWKSRDERTWPAGLRAGGTWPWVPVTREELDIRSERGFR